MLLVQKKPLKVMSQTTSDKINRIIAKPVTSISLINGTFEVYNIRRLLLSTRRSVFFVAVGDIIKQSLNYLISANFHKKICSFKVKT